MSTTAIFGSYVLSRKDGAQDVLRDHWVLVEGKTIAAVTRSKPNADQVYDRPGRFVLPGLLNLHNHCFSEAVARSHSEDGNGSLTLNWSLTTADTGAQGITIQELAIFANHASAGLPGTTAPTPMLARKTIAPIVFSAGMSISGTWTLTF